MSSSPARTDAQRTSFAIFIGHMHLGAQCPCTWHEHLARAASVEEGAGAGQQHVRGCGEDNPQSFASVPRCLFSLTARLHGFVGFSFPSLWPGLGDWRGLCASSATVNMTIRHHPGRGGANLVWELRKFCIGFHNPREIVRIGLLTMNNHEQTTREIDVSAASTRLG